MLKKKFFRFSKRKKALAQIVFNIFQFFSIIFSAVSYLLSLKSFKWTVLSFFFSFCCLVSFILWFIARLQLGTSISFFASVNGPLITTGIYALFRNPIYIFSALTIIFYIFLIQQYELFVFIVLLVPVQIYRSKKEEVLLKQVFGDDYETYIKSVII
jgi:protein-S-isoprenylcysteine O-methyltransferase Ste14